MFALSSCFVYRNKCAVLCECELHQERTPCCNCMCAGLQIVCQFLLFALTGVVRPLVDITRTAQKEKVFRVAMNCLKNLLEDEELHNNLASDMIESGLQKVVITRQLQVCLSCVLLCVPHRAKQHMHEDKLSHTRLIALSCTDCALTALTMCCVLCSHGVMKTCLSC